jgi:hypothetical protein
MAAGGGVAVQLLTCSNVNDRLDFPPILSHLGHHLSEGDR